MLAKAARLNINKNFKFVTAGSRHETASLKLYWRTGENTHPMVGIAVAKKNFRLAVARNKVKRMVFKAVESVYERLQPSLNLVIMPKSDTIKRSVEELAKELSDEKRLYRVD